MIRSDLMAGILGTEAAAHRKRSSALAKNLTDFPIVMFGVPHNAIQFTEQQLIFIDKNIKLVFNLIKLNYFKLFK